MTESEAREFLVNHSLHHHVEIKSLVGKTSRITIEAKVAQGIGKPVGEIRIDMITEIVNGGRAGIVPRTYFEIWERRVKVNTYDILEDALNDYNGRTGE